jgi:hypothetical protein
MNQSCYTFIVVPALLGAAGCEFRARSPEDYRNDTRALLETRSPQIQRCYDDVLVTHPNASGSVVVGFTVTEASGTVANPRLLPESTAPAALGECVVKALDGLALKPPDERQGDATFLWEFTSS